MLRSLYLVACENAIVADNGLTSLISVLERVESELPAIAPEKILVPMKWFVVCLWTRDENDVPEPIPYEQDLRIVTNDGEEIFTVAQPFLVTSANVNFRNITEFPAFPITPSGRVNVNAKVRKVGTDEWSEAITYTILVHRRTSEAQNDNNQIGNVNNETEG